MARTPYQDPAGNKTFDAADVSKRKLGSATVYPETDEEAMDIKSGQKDYSPK